MLVIACATLLHFIYDPQILPDLYFYQFESTTGLFDRSMADIEAQDLASISVHSA